MFELSQSWAVVLKGQILKLGKRMNERELILPDRVRRRRLVIGYHACEQQNCTAQLSDSHNWGFKKSPDLEHTQNIIIIRWRLPPLENNSEFQSLYKMTML